MDDPGAHQVTILLQQWSKGDRAAFDQVFPLVYNELHRIAKRFLGRRDSAHTLQTTAVIHEAYVKLARGSGQSLGNRGHFYAVAAKAMRHILLDHARSRLAAKRGGSGIAVTLDDGVAALDGPAEEIVALNDALDVLAAAYPRQAEVVELRYFAGLSGEEVAETLATSPATVARDWRFAKSFLKRELQRNG